MFSTPPLDAPLALNPLPEKPRVLGGAVFCLISALAYTAANVCMRELTVLRCDPIWAVFQRELFTSLLIGPWLLYQTVGRRMTWPGPRRLAAILAAGVLVELVGNVAAQWALGTVGLTVTIPAMFGVAMAGGAFFAWVWLSERVTLRSISAMGLLVGSLVLLGLGAEATDGLSGAGPFWVALGVAAGGVSGAANALLSTVIRHSVTRATSPEVLALLVPLMGVVGLGPPGLYRVGLEGVAVMPLQQWAVMAAAGAFNLLGFLALIHGLQRTTVVHANVIGASQVAMAAAAGMALFGEPPNPWLILGICLTIGGIVGIDHPTEGAGL